MKDEKGLQNEMGKFRNGVGTTLKQLKVSLHEMVRYVHVILKVLHVTLYLS